MLARISAVQHMIGASGLTLASPVSMPTSDGPDGGHSAQHFSDTSALLGPAYDARRRGDGGTGRDQALARAGRRAEGDVRARRQLDQRLFLVRVQAQPLSGRPAGEGLVDLVRA